jgi:hypothetical protein
MTAYIFQIENFTTGSLTLNYFSVADPIIVFSIWKIINALMELCRLLWLGSISQRLNRTFYFW